MAIADNDWKHFINSARGKLPGASDAMIKNELFDVLHEFFTISSSWLENITVPVVAGTLEYVLIPTEGQIVRLAALYDPSGIARPAIMPTVGTLRLGYPTNIDQTYTATVVKTVSLPTEDHAKPLAPDWVFPLWGPSILDGLLGRMMGQLSKSYSNPALSTYHLKRFLNAIAAARSHTLAGNTMGGQAWAFPRQFGRGTQRGGFSTSNTGGF